MSIIGKCKKCGGETVDYTCANCQYDRVAELESENERLTQALIDIINPIEYLRRTCPSGSRLDGDTAVRFSESVGCIQGIARSALSEKGSA